MTAQFSGRLINECPEVDLNGLHLYAVLVGDIKNSTDIKPYQFSQKPNPNKINIFTACWNGYISEYKITRNKELLLTGFQYPALLPEKIEPDEANELASGDFWLDLRPDFFGEYVYVPFIDGKLLANQEEWIFHKPYNETVINHSTNWFSKIKKFFNY